MGGYSPSRRARAFRTREHVGRSWRRADGVQKVRQQAHGDRRRGSDLGLPQHRTAQLATAARRRTRDPGARCGTQGQRRVISTYLYASSALRRARESTSPRPTLMHCPLPSRGRHRGCLRGSVGRARLTRRTPAVGGAQGAVPLLEHGAAVLHPLAARAGLHAPSASQG